MKKRTIALGGVGLYLLMRFVTLMAAVLLMVDRPSDPALGGLVLALGAGGIVPVLLVLQLAVTGSPVLLAPTRVSALLQTVGSVLLLIRLVGTAVGVMTRPASLIGVAVLLVLLDALTVVFLLFYRGDPHSAHTDAAEPADTAARPEIAIEDLEE